MNVIKVDGGQLIFSWCKNLDDNAMQQMVAIAKLPFVKHCAIMPDGHLGQNCCIGGVVACDGIVVPDFVGSDAGCGVIVQKTSLKRSDLMDKELRKKILNSIKRGLPVGMEHNSEKREKELLNNFGGSIENLLDNSSFSYKFLGDKGVYDTILSQIATLGSGNHFCSIEYDSNDDVWIMIHSGSRNIGYRLNEYYNEAALKLNQTYYSNSFVPFLPVDTTLGVEYIYAMKFALEFAQLNRSIMIKWVMADLSHFFPDITFGEQINIHHNYANYEFVNGKDIWVHRKGAVNASKGVRGVIPASMGTGSYIVDGLGNPKSLNSSSHGAGRRMGRKDFNKLYNTPEDLAKIAKIMEDVVYLDFSKEKGRGKKVSDLIDVSECPLAYKDIETVMAEQSDLVAPVNKLMPMINLKG